MTLDALLQEWLTKPSPAVLRQLQPYLLGAEGPQAAGARAAAQLCYTYWNRVASKLDARQASTLGAALEAGSVGGVALQEVLHIWRDDPGALTRSLLMTGLTGALEVLAAAQQIRAWQREFSADHHDMAWALYEQYWQLSCETQPRLGFDQRQRLLEALIGPVTDPALETPAQVLLALRLLQVLVMLRVALLMPRAALEGQI